MLTLLLSATLFLKRQQLSIEDQSLHISHILIKQMACSLAPLIDHYDNNTNDNNKHILSSLNLLVKNDWLLDVSVYLLNGQLIASAGEKITARDRLGLDDSTLTHHKTDQLIERIELQGRPIAFIRFTVDNAKLKPASSSFEQIKHIICGIILFAILTGFILTKTLQQRGIKLASLPQLPPENVNTTLSTNVILSDMPEHTFLSDNTHPITKEHNKEIPLTTLAK